MKRILMLMLCVGLFISGAVLAQTDDTFIDPNGQFTVPIPTNWTAEAQDDYVLLNDPDRLINVYVLVTEGETAEDGIAAAWALVDPDFVSDARDVIVPPPPAGIDEYAVVNYDTGDQTRIVQAVGQRVGSSVYVIIFDAELNAILQRNAQAQIIATGFQITGQVDTDLSEVEPLQVDDEIVAAFEAYTSDLMERLEVPGATVAIVQNGEIVYVGAFGVKTLGGDDPVAIDSQFMIGSTTKPMTTTMMASLVDDGIISWDTPVVDVLPDFAVADPDLTQQFTIRNLVCACTGVPRRDYELLFNANELSAEDIVASLRTFQFFTDFGEAFQYSNQLVATGGYAAGAALAPGEDLMLSYLDAMQERIFDPIGMPDTTFDFDVVTARNDYATPHGVNLNGEYDPLPLSVEATLLPITPAGGAWSTVGDMARYVMTMIARGVAPDGERIVSSENLLTTWEPQVAMTADTDYGLGWIVSEYKGAPLLSHGGNTLGFTSDLAFMPDADLGVVVLSNGQASNLFNEGIRMRLLELVYEQPMETDEQIQFVIDYSEANEEQLAETVGEALAETDVETWLGVYTSEVLGMIDFRYEDGKFLGDAGEFVFELRPNISEDADPNSFFSFGAPIAGLPIKFVEVDGDVTMVLGAAVTEYTFTRAE